MFEYLEEIDNGSLRRAHRMSYEGAIWEGIESGDIYGEEEVVDGEIFYKNLSLTKSGKKLLRFSQLTLEDIDNAYGKNSLREWLIKPIVVAAVTAIVTTALATPMAFYLGKAMTADAEEQGVSSHESASEDSSGNQ